jgi:hypothetical protein
MLVMNGLIYFLVVYIVLVTRICKD